MSSSVPPERRSRLEALSEDKLRVLLAMLRMPPESDNFRAVEGILLRPAGDSRSRLFATVPGDRRALITAIHEAAEARGTSAEQRQAAFNNAMNNMERFWREQHPRVFREVHTMLSSTVNVVERREEVIRMLAAMNAIRARGSMDTNVPGARPFQEVYETELETLRQRQRMALGHGESALNLDAQQFMALLDRSMAMPNGMADVQAALAFVRKPNMDALGADVNRIFEGRTRVIAGFRAGQMPSEVVLEALLENEEFDRTVAGAPTAERAAAQLRGGMEGVIAGAVATASRTLNIGELRRAVSRQERPGLSWDQLSRSHGIGGEESLRRMSSLLMRMEGERVVASRAAGQAPGAVIVDREYAQTALRLFTRENAEVINSLNDRQRRTLLRERTGPAPRKESVEQAQAALLRAMGGAETDSPEKKRDLLKRGVDILAFNELLQKAVAKDEPPGNTDETREVARARNAERDAALRMMSAVAEHARGAVSAVPAFSQQVGAMERMGAAFRGDHLQNERNRYFSNSIAEFVSPLPASERNPRLSAMRSIVPALSGFTPASYLTAAISLYQARQRLAEREPGSGARAEVPRAVDIQNSLLGFGFDSPLYNDLAALPDALRGRIISAATQAYNEDHRAFRQVLQAAFEGNERGWAGYRSTAVVSPEPGITAVRRPSELTGEQIDGLMRDYIRRRTSRFMTLVRATAGRSPENTRRAVEALERMYVFNDWRSGLTMLSNNSTPSRRLQEDYDRIHNRVQGMNDEQLRGRFSELLNKLQTEHFRDFGNRVPIRGVNRLLRQISGAEGLGMGPEAERAPGVDTALVQAREATSGLWNEVGGGDEGPVTSPARRPVARRRPGEPDVPDFA